MRTPSTCPKCGKPLTEQQSFPGIFTCADYETPINSAPPFEFKCDGMIIGGEAVQAFEQAIVDHLQVRLPRPSKRE